MGSAISAGLFVLHIASLCFCSSAAHDRGWTDYLISSLRTAVLKDLAYQHLVKHGTQSPQADTDLSAIEQVLRTSSVALQNQSHSCSNSKRAMLGD